MPSARTQPSPSARSIDVTASTASRLPRLQAASKSKLLAVISRAMLRTDSTACENCRCWMSCSVRATSAKRCTRALPWWRSRMRPKSAMQRSMPLRSFSAKYENVSSTSDWKSNSLESMPRMAARASTLVAVSRSPM